jgi:hypothetical protein
MEAVSGAPIGGATVTVSAASPPTVVSAISTADGHFAVPDLPAGRFILAVSRGGYLDTTYGASWPGEPGLPIVLSPSQPMREVQVSVQRSAAVFGDVRNSAGRPLPGAVVTVYSVTQIGGVSGAEPVHTVRADDRGHYRAFGLDAGEFVVAVTPASLAGAGLRRMSDERIDVLLKALQEGRRTEPPHIDTSSADQEVHSQPVPVFFPGASTAGPAGSMTVGFGDEYRLDLIVPVSQSSSLGGTVLGLDPGTTAFVTLEPRPVVGTFVMRAATRSASTDADGMFTFRGVGPGLYRVTARASRTDPGGGRARSIWARGHVTVTGGQKGSVVLAVGPGVNLSGRVAAGSVREGQPFPSMTIQLVPAGTKAALPALRASVAPDGRFELTDVPHDHYRVAVAFGASDVGRWRAESATCGATDAIDVPCDVSELGQGLLVTVTDQPSGLAGRLDTAGVFAPESLLVVVFPQDETTWIPGSRRLKSTRPDADGGFAFDLPAGTYLVGVVTAGRTARATSPDVLAQLRPQAVTVIVPRGHVVQQDLRIGTRASPMDR